MGIALVVGLGNPGPEYSRTRHNVGYWFVERLAARARVSFCREPKFHGEVCKWADAGRECWLLKPLTYMNLSGDSVAALSRFYRILPEQILVVHDELDLPPGTVRLKKGGGAGGHKGLTDTMEKLSSREFHRLRIGIGHPGARELVTPYVLGRASPEDECLIEASIDAALPELPRLIDGEFDKVMNHLNRRKPPPDAGEAPAIER